jgi:hypothetical protein
VNLPPQAGAERDAAILARIGSKDYDAITYAELDLTGGGHELAVYVFADALKMDGVRLNVSARVAQQIADVLSCALLTAKLADLLYLARTPATLLPSPQPISSSTAAMVAHSARIDAQLAAANLPPAPGAGSGSIYQSVGKHWILDNDTLSHTGRACNYGWHFPGSSFDGQAWEPSVTLGLRVVQGRGWAHDVDHVDYSQTCVLASRSCTVDGQKRDLLDVYQDPSLASLVSAQGPLKLTRQPGVALYSSPPDVWIPVKPPVVSSCPNVGFAPLVNVLPWSGVAPAALQTWSMAMLRFPLGTVIRDTVNGVPIVARLECHDRYMAHPELPPAWHKGVTLYRPAARDASGKLVALTSPPPGWPGSSSA